MTDQPTETVIAGSKGFALALLAPLTERVGTRPRVAADPAQALKLTGGSGLVVVEFQGDRSLEAIRQLLVQAAGVSVVAAVPGALAQAEDALRSLGVEPARWDGNPDDVLSAVARLTGVRDGPRAGATPAGAPVPPTAAAVILPPPSAAAPPPLRGAAATPVASPPPGGASRVGALFDDLSLDDIDDVAAEPPPAGSATPPAAIAAPPAPAGAASTAWPANVSGPVEAADALGQGLQGVFAPAGSPLAVVAGVMAAMSPLERAVLLGEPQPVDVEPIRRAAVMRVRVAVALAIAPQAPGAAPTDQAAVSALLADLDGLLSDVNALAAAAPPELQPSLEQVRNDLVKEAIDFSEAAHRASSGEAAAAPTRAEAEQRAAARRAAGTRLLAIASAAERDAERSAARRRAWMWAVLAVTVAAGVVFHGQRYLRAREAASELPARRSGAPADALVSGSNVPGGPTMIQAKDGRTFTPEELKRMEDAEALRGNTVRVVGSSVIVVPAAASSVAPSPSIPAGSPTPAPAEVGGAQGAPPAAPAR